MGGENYEKWEGGAPAVRQVRRTQGSHCEVIRRRHRRQTVRTRSGDRHGTLSPPSDQEHLQQGCPQGATKEEDRQAQRQDAFGGTIQDRKEQVVLQEAPVLNPFLLCICFGQLQSPLKYNRMKSKIC